MDKHLILPLGCLNTQLLLADTFFRSLLQAAGAFKHTDIVFDRYCETSIESGTRKKQGKDFQPIIMIESRDIFLPAKWDTSLPHSDIKADLARFLS